MMKSLVLLTLLVLNANAQAGYRDEAVAAAPTCMNVVNGCIQQLLSQIKPFSVGVLGGMGFAALETELIDPVLAHYNDMVAVSLGMTALGGAGYLAYTHQDNQVVQQLEQPATLAGVFAGLIAWYYCLAQ